MQNTVNFDTSFQGVTQEIIDAPPWNETDCDTFLAWIVPAEPFLN